EPAWARKFEPASITGGETFGIMRSLLDLYLETGENRFLEPIPKALAWAKRSRLSDGRLARFYELKTNTPLYFTKDYTLTYDDSDMPTHYAFKVSGNRIEGIERTYNRIINDGREKILSERNRAPQPDPEQIQEIIQALDEQGRWVENDSLRNPENRRERIETEILSCRTFNRNLTLLARYVKSQK
ncbi:MAG: polysaccharide lyase, partial [Candidatus Latescibacteria bacterium]|nr:polysaccharide lyase [Candidatus Latescibacterota bacterium]